MPLSEIIIQDLVSYHTNALISDASYHTLRHYLLERKPLGYITNTINAVLGDLRSADRVAFIHDVTNSACEAQKNRDVQEAQSDTQEYYNDYSLKTRYTQELSGLEFKLIQLDNKCFQQKTYLSQIRNQQNEQITSLNQINRSIDRIHHERLFFNHQYQCNFQYAPVTIHGHYSQNTLDINFYPHQSMAYPIHNHLIWDNSFNNFNNFNEENSLIAERQRLESLIEAGNALCGREEQNLNQFLSEKTQIEDRCKELTRQINTVLPNKEHQRLIRNQERLVRANARETNDPELNQLSHSERETLKQQIMAKNQELNELTDQLWHQAVKSSYSAYLILLEQRLQTATISQITFTEREALKSIVAKMNKYNEMEEQEQNIIHSLNCERNKLTIMQTTLAECMTNLQRYTTHRPQLIQQNQELLEQNRILKISRDYSANARTNSLLCTILGGVSLSSLLTASLVGSLMVSPIFIAISGYLALLTVVSLIFTVVNHLDKTANEEKINQNDKVIRENEKTIIHLKQQSKELTLKTIPELKVNIEKSEQSIVILEKQLTEQQRVMSHAFQTAENVTEAYNGNNAFFNGANGTFFSPPIPTAPLYDNNPGFNYGP